MIVTKENMHTAANEYILMTQFIAEVHKNAIAKGFWEDKKDNTKKDLVLALIVSEISELLEAMRIEKRYANKGRIQHDKFVTWFEENVKGTIEEELADICIRAFDYMAAYDMQATPALKYMAIEMDAYKHVKIAPAPFTLYIIKTVMDLKWSFRASQSMGELLGKCFTLARHYKIDLWKFIEWKVKYNAQRPVKHNKKF